MNARGSLISELEESIRNGSRNDRVTSLRRVTDLFLATTDRLSDEQIEVFDDVISHLMERVENNSLVELSRRLAPVETAPNEVIQALARNDEIAVAEPVLAQSKRLSKEDLLEIAQSKSQNHLYAISGRKRLGAPITDVLMQRGDNKVVQRLAGNSGARFSEDGFSRLVDHAVQDETLAEKLGRRVDIPLKQFRELILRATESVRARVLAIATPKDIVEIQSIIATVGDSDPEPAGPRDYTAAHEAVLALQKNKELNDDALLKFVRENKYEELVASFSVMCSVPFELIDGLLHGESYNALLVPCRAGGLEWPTVRNILKNRPSPQPISERDLNKAATEYEKLSQATALRVMRFWHARDSEKSE